MTIAPITLFVYNRLDHTKRTIEALQKNELARDSDLIIFSDAAKNETGAESVRMLRTYLKTVSGFKSVNIVERFENFGLAKSIINGVTEVVNKYSRIIVLEDDLIISPYFLKYMNEALDMYENEEAVISIHGYMYPVKKELPETFFLKGVDCWGWATWKRGWDLFEPDGQKLLNELKSKKGSKEFDFSGGYPYTQMLKGQIRGFNNSWAIRWHASAFLKNKLTLYPGESLVQNIGLDSSGTHTSKHGSDLFVSQIKNKPIKLELVTVQENAEALKIIKQYFFLTTNDFINHSYENKILFQNNKKICQINL